MSRSARAREIRRLLLEIRAQNAELIEQYARMVADCRDAVDALRRV